MDRWWSHGHCNSRAVGWLCLHSLCTCFALATAAVFAEYAPLHRLLHRNTCRLWQNFCIGTVVDLLQAHSECHTSTSILRQSKRTELAHKSTMMCYNGTSSQKATGCSSKLAGGQKIRSCSKTMLQLTRPRGTCNASTTPSREGTFWNGPN